MSAQDTHPQLLKFQCLPGQFQVAHKLSALNPQGSFSHWALITSIAASKSG